MQHLRSERVGFLVGGTKTDQRYIFSPRGLFYIYTCHTRMSNDFLEAKRKFFGFFRRKGIDSYIRAFLPLFQSLSRFHPRKSWYVQKDIRVSHCAKFVITLRHASFKRMPQSVFIYHK